MDEKKQRILVGIPTMGTNDYRFTLSLASLALPENTTLMVSPRAMIDTSRNLICEKFLSDITYTHLLMIDDDHTFESDLALRLLSHDVDIVGALAFKRRLDFQPCVYKKNKENKLYQPILPQVFQEVDIVGTGAILIKREVIKKMKFPWFWTDYDEDGTHWSVDFRFCQKAKKAGFKIFVDSDVKIGHIGNSEIINQDTFLNNIKKSNNNNIIK